VILAQQVAVGLTGLFKSSSRYLVYLYIWIILLVRKDTQQKFETWGVAHLSWKRQGEFGDNRCRRTKECVL